MSDRHHKQPNQSKLSDFDLEKYSSQTQRIIGLTGGVGMGKTTVSNHLASVHHLPILDADVYAREVVEPGSTVLTQIADRYGTGILLADGTLDRRRLGEIVFSSSPERIWLEQQIHPQVRDRMETQLRAILAESHPAVVLVVPLLFEARMTDMVTEVWVVQCSQAQQLDRLIERDRLTPKQAQARISSQLSIEKKAKRADVVLNNSSTLEALLKQVDIALAPPQKLLVEL